MSRRKRFTEASAPPPPHRGQVVGRIIIVQEDRFRLVDGRGRGFLFITRKGAATLEELERWRDEGARLRVSYQGVPDSGALADLVRPL